jgi:hypothetical protein
MIKQRRMRKEGHIACMRKRGMHTEFWQEYQKERDNYKNLDMSEY